MNQTGDSGGKEHKEQSPSQTESSEPQDSNKPGERNAPEQSTGESHGKKPLYRRPAFIVIASVVVVIGLTGAILFWLYERHYVSTTDAYIDGNVTQISARVSAPVIALRVDDNQLVHKGDVMMELDATDFQIALAQARAQAVSAQGKLAQAQAQITTAKASVLQAQARMGAAQVQFDNASRDLNRYEQVDPKARSKEQLDNERTAEKNAQSQLEQAKARKTSAEADVTAAEAAVKAAQGELQTSEANEKRARVNLSYCKIYAPVGGRVTERTVDVGNYVAPGQALFMLVDPNVWVTANFKETSLTHMKPGQPVTISVDAYPGKKWRGHVDSIQAGSGSRFSVLPAENATGNFVKIVQRVPVKIVFDHGPNTNDAELLSPGLSVEPRVKVR